MKTGQGWVHVDPPSSYKKIKLRCLGSKYKEKLMYAMKVYYYELLEMYKSDKK